MDVDRWLRDLGLEQYAPLFRANAIDGALLRQLDNADLKELGVAALGHRKRLLAAIAALEGDAGAPASAAAADAEGERKVVTVLFADLKSSMELLAARDPEDARRILDPVIELMMEAVHRFGGTVNQVMGDGIMALFGAPVAHEDHAVRACYAALRMQQALERHAASARAAHGIALRMRIGIHSGEVVVRSIGNDLRTDYSAVGETTHLAARMEQSAPPGTARLTAHTARLVEGYVELKPLGACPVKGLAEPVDAYELAGVGPARTRLQATALRGLARFVGRDTELELLHRALAQAGSGHGQVVAVVGEAGVGKSRLVHEFVHSPEVLGWRVLEAPSVSYGKATSYLPVIGLLKSHFGIGDRDDHRQMRDKVQQAVAGLGGPLEPALSALLALLDVPLEDPAWAALDPRQRRHRTLGAVKRLLLCESELRPLLVVFEDLHWIDGESQALLDSLVESLASSRLLLLVNYRPEYRHHWGNRSVYSQLRLDSLPAPRAAELLAAFLGPDPTLAALMQVLARRGNPFFLEETLRTLVETGVLAGERGAYRLTHPVEALDVPETVQTVLLARIDRLPPDEKKLLQAASAIGKDVPHELLAAVSGQPEPALTLELAHLQEAEFLYEARHFPDLEYTFKHALTHDVTYSSLLRERRRELHARTVVAIEHLYADRLNEHVERLATHALRGELWEQAVRYGRRAGRRALDRSAAREALSAFEQARTALRALPGTRERSEQLIDICFDQRNAYVSLGDFSSLGEVVNEARALAEALGDERRLGWALGYLALHHGILGEHALAVEAGARACEIAEAEGSVDLRAAAMYYSGLALWYAGDPQRAAAAPRAALALVQGAPFGERFRLVAPPAVALGFVLALVLADLGDFAEGIAAGEEGLRIGQATGHPYSEVLARWSLGYAHLRRGDFAAAARALEPGLAFCRAMEIRFALPYIAAFLGSAYLASDRAQEGVALLEEAVESNAAMRIVGHRVLFVTLLGSAYATVGRPAEARQLAEEAVALARSHPARGWEAWGLKLLGDVLAHDPAAAQDADSHHRRALELANALGMRPLAAHCHLALGRLHARRHAHEPARSHFGAAAALYRETDMPFWREQAEAGATDPR